MDVLLLCGYFEPKYQDEINSKTKTWVENAANTFQQRLIKGLKKQDVNLTIVSAPFIGPWPNAYKDFSFNGFCAGESEEVINYVSFNNVWGFRNISRANALKKSVKDFINKSNDAEKAIIVYCPHTPFLEAAVYGKQLDKSTHIHMVVPDLPQYMNLSKKSHLIYDFFKKIDIYKMNKLIEQVDSFTLLTKHMADKLNVGKRPFIVVEGIVDDDVVIPEKKKINGKAVAYAGKLVEAFGVKRLIEAFELIEDKEATLHICGGGELKKYVEDMSANDKRIHYYGVVSAEKAREILLNADVLVNPRLNDDEYTKYSFPSKNIEYLMTGNKVVAYMLDGIPDNYKYFFTVPNSNKVESLAEAIKFSITSIRQDYSINRNKLLEYTKNHCYSKNIALRILNTIRQNKQKLNKPIIVQQATDLSVVGGITSEFKALEQSSLKEKYDIIPMVLPKVHKKVNFQDIHFYYEFLSRVRPDIVHIRGAAIDGLNAQIAARMVKGTKILVCIHGMFSELVYMSWAKKIIHEYIVEPIIFSMCDGISCVYKNGNNRPQLKRFQNKILPYVYNRMPVIDTISNEEWKRIRTKYGIPLNATLGLYCGRFNREKGLGYLLESFRLMKNQWPSNLYILLLGDGDYLREFKQKCIIYKIDSKVICIGAIKNVHPFLRISDFFIMPSLHENHSIALLEAIAAELPTIATNVGGNPEIIRNGVEGILIPEANSEILKNAILKIYNNTLERDYYKSQIINNKYKQFSKNNVDAQLDKVYQIMLER